MISHVASKSITAMRYLMCVFVLLCSSSVYAQHCDGVIEGNGVPLTTQSFEHQFDSGARWQLCWHIDEHAGLKLSNIAYGAPQEEMREVLKSASLAQILLKYDSDISAKHVLAENGLGALNHVEASSQSCTGGEVQLHESTAICSKLINKNSLTSLRRSVSKRRHEISLHGLSAVGSQSFEQVWRFSEDGQIIPAVRMSGELDRFTRQAKYGSVIDAQDILATNASLLFTWRLDFNIAGTAHNDLVEQVEFIPSGTQAVKRSINTKLIDVESMHNVNRTRFRGWLIKDADVYAGSNGATRIGYYLDPQTSGFDFTSRRYNWANYAIAITKSSSCEKLASGNKTVHAECADSLDEFVNAESLTGEDISLWFSLAKPFVPKSEDYPAIATREAYFKLIPFDWSASTPFSELEQ